MIALVAAIPIQTVAEPAEDETVIPLDRIIVTANRTETSANRVGSAVAVLTSEDLDAGGDLLLADQLSRLPGVSTTASGPAGSATEVRIRGAAPRYVAVFVDGIRVDDPTNIAPSFDFGSLTGVGVGRVEVLRGTQSALYGGSAVAGIVSVQSLRPVSEGFSQRIQVEGGSYNTRRLAYDLGYLSDRLEARLSLGHVKSDGFSAVDTLPRDPSLDSDGIEANRLGFGLRYDLTDEMVVGLDAFGQRTTADYDGWWQEDAVQKRHEAGARLYAEWAHGASVHTFEVSRYELDRDLFEGAPGADFYHSTRTTFGYKGVTDVGTRLQFVYGVDSMRETGRTAGMVDGMDARTTGLYGQAQWAATSDLDLSLAVRGDHNSEFGNFASGRLSGVWRPTETLALRGAVARGFLAPSFYQRAGAAEWGIAPASDLDPERSLSYELGADLDLASGASVGLTFFQLEIDNAITYCGKFTSLTCDSELPDGFTNRYENREGLSRNRGVELEASVPLTERLSLAGSYTYTDARDPSGNRRSRVPYHDASLTLQAALVEDVSGQLGLTHISGRPTGDGDSFTVVNAALAWDLALDTSVTLRLENLLDKSYQEVAGYGTSERAVYVGLRKSF